MIARPPFDASPDALVIAVNISAGLVLRPDNQARGKYNILEAGQRVSGRVARRSRVGGARGAQRALGGCGALLSVVTEILIMRPLT